jgi:hypothetical protein
MVWSITARAGEWRSGDVEPKNTGPIRTYSGIRCSWRMEREAKGDWIMRSRAANIRARGVSFHSIRMGSDGVWK